jgi:hypothetical protein
VLSTDYATNFHHSFQRRGPAIRENLLIVTLDPNKFAEKKQQRLDIGDQQTFNPNVMLHNQSSPVKSMTLYYDGFSVSRTGTSTVIHFTYPTDTKSFLYYFTPPGKPRIAAELRLRVTTRDDPASFESGSDLLKFSGQPWSRPLCVLPRYYNPLYQKLREDRLVPDDLDAILSTSTSKPKYCGSQRLYTFNDTFFVDFNSIDLRLFVITEQGIEALRCRNPFCEGLFKILPYTGAYTNHHLLIRLD